MHVASRRVTECAELVEHGPSADILQFACAENGEVEIAVGAQLTARGRPVDDRRRDRRVGLQQLANRKETLLRHVRILAAGT